MTADLSDLNDDMTEADGRSIRFNLNHQMMMNPSNQQKFDRAGSTGSLLSCIRHALAKRISFLLAAIIILSSFVTPILFITLPRFKLTSEWQLNECGLECEAILIGIVFKLFVLLVGYCAMYLFKSRRSNQLPSVAFELKTMLLIALFIMTSCYWLFYSVRIIETNTADYHKILQFTDSYVDALLFLFVISVFVLELRHLKPAYVVRVMRSPDGEQREYDLGTMSIQRAALVILEQYYRDFHAFNPWLESAHRKRTMQLEQINNNGKKRGNFSISISF